MTPTIRYDPLDRVTRTDFPDGTISRVEFDAWRQEEWDQNDCVYDPSEPANHSRWYIDRNSPDPDSSEPSLPTERAAWLAAQHAATPTVIHLDTLGRPFLSVAHNVTGMGTSRVHEFYRTRTELDIQGNTLAIYDARQHETDDSSDDLKGAPYVPYATIAQRFDVLGRRLRIDSPDAGTRLTVQDAAGKPLRQWDSRGQTMRWQYDELQRPTHQYVAKGTAEQLVSRIVYGEALDDPNAPTSPSPAQDANLRGQAHLVFDGAGLLKSERLDFKGNLLKASRRLATAYQTTPTWDALASLTAPDAIEQEVDSESLLEAEVFTSEHEYDALNRVTGALLPASGSVHPNLTRPRYNEAGLLDEVRVSVRGATEQLVVKDIEYNARGQRLRCEHADPATGDASFSISYEYDPETFRLTTITTRRTSDEALLQKLEYTYDAVGNITEVRDTATWDSTLANLAAPGHGQYRYDALYRLVFATGREHPGQQPAHGEPPRWDIPHGNDLQGVEAYREHIEYDPVGNIIEMRHLRGTSSNASWRRRYKYAESSNRLVATSLPGDQENEYTAVYEYEDSVDNDGGAHGSITHMPHLDELHWDYADRLQHTIKSSGSNQHTYFTYDASGERVRKVYEHNNLIEERIYLGGVEVYRRRSGVTLELERETLHVMDDQRRVAMVETKLADPGSLDPAPLDSPRWRFQLDNHLGSSALELDHEANVISYEEYHPYGSTAFHTAASGAGVSRKRYRYTGKERDEETDLYYHGARYYAPWLGRWTAADPLGIVDGPQVYGYARMNPVAYSDPRGTESQEGLPGGSNYDPFDDPAIIAAAEVRWRQKLESGELERDLAEERSASQGAVPKREPEPDEWESGRDDRRKASLALAEAQFWWLQESSREKFREFFREVKDWESENCPEFELTPLGTERKYSRDVEKKKPPTLPLMHSIGLAMDFTITTREGVVPYQRLGEEQFEPYLAEVAKIADKHGITWGGMFMGTPKPEHWEDRGGKPLSIQFERNVLEGKDPFTGKPSDWAKKRGVPDRVVTPARR